MSWPSYKLGDICQTTQGIQITKANTSDESYDGGYRYLYIADFISDKKLSFVDNKYDNKKVTVDDLVMANTGSPGRVFKGKKGILSNNLFRISYDIEIVDRDYLYLMLSSKQFQQTLQTQMKGGIQKHLGHQTIARQVIVLPPLPEQKRIAAILDKADAIRRKRQQAIELADEFLRSVFLDMFGDPVVNPKGWDRVALSDFANCQLGKMLSAKAKNGLTPKKYLRNANIRWRRIDISNVLEMDFSQKEQQKFFLEKGDLLVCEGGEVGRSAIWNNQLKDCYFQKALHRVRISHSTTPEYLQEYFYWMGKQNGFSQSVSEVTFKHLTAEKLKSLMIPLPPLLLQEKFSAIYSLYERTLYKSQERLNQQEKLFNSLSQKAFSGNL